MMSSVNHDDLAHLKIPLENILAATNNFDDENLNGEDASEKDYEGQLLWSGELINILARRLNKEWFDGDQQFWTEVSMLSILKHKNLVSLVGFCDDNDEKVIIYKRETRESLQCHLSDSILLTWVRRLEISVGIAQALSYIHYDESRDFSLIHHNIESSLIYLNDDWEPKLGDFSVIHRNTVISTVVIDHHRNPNSGTIVTVTVFTVIKLVSKEEEEGSPERFPIEPVDPSFFSEEDGKIYGYQGLKNIFADNLAETKDDFLKTFSTENQYIKSMFSDGKILQPSVNSKGLKDSKADELEVVCVEGESMGLLYCRLVAIPLMLMILTGRCTF